MNKSIRSRSWWWLRALTFLNKGLTYHMVYLRHKVQQWSGQHFTLTSLVDRGDYQLLSSLGDVPGLPPPRVLLHNIPDSIQSLIVYMSNRSTPYFHFADPDVSGIVEALPKPIRQKTIQAAEDICQHRFTFRGIGPIQFQQVVQWEKTLDSLNWIYDLNRHYIWNILGRAYRYTQDERYAAKFVELVLDWLANCPLDVQDPRWRPFEVGVRLTNWIWAWYLFSSSPLFQKQGLIPLLKGLLMQGRFLATCLEYHVPNNHLLLEAKALAQVGLLFPEFRAAQRWLRVGLKVMWQQVERQVTQDGVHIEQTTLYQRIIASELGEMLLLLQKNGWHIPALVLERFQRMVEFESALRHPDGSFPLLGDSARTDPHIHFNPTRIAAALGLSIESTETGCIENEETDWLAIPDVSIIPQLTCPISQAFPLGGYWIMQHGYDHKLMRLVFDGGPFGHSKSPGHGHADALSFELFAQGQALLVDSGGYAYQAPDRWRHYFRGTAAHNTVMIDEQDQSLLVGRRDVFRPARVKINQWLTSEIFDVLDASHDGYERLDNPVRHRRQIVFVKPLYWIVIDTLTGQGSHRFDLLFHLATSLDWQLDSGCLTIEKDTKRFKIALLTPSADVAIIQGNENPIQGWVSLDSEFKEPAAVLRCRYDGPVPVQFVSLLFPEFRSEGHIQQWKKLETAQVGVTAWQIQHTGPYFQTDDILIKQPTGPETVTGGAWQTDAELLVAHSNTQSLENKNVLICYGSQAWLNGQPVIQLPQRVDGHQVAR